jgi:hypothetical protein
MCTGVSPKSSMSRILALTMLMAMSNSLRAPRRSSVYAIAVIQYCVAKWWKGVLSFEAEFYKIVREKWMKAFKASGRTVGSSVFQRGYFGIVSENTGEIMAAVFVTWS